MGDRFAPDFAQPKRMEDRVKFSKLMGISSLEKSISSSKFKTRFLSELNGQNLKSANTLIDNLSNNEIEVKIPYPIGDYPSGTDIAVVSDPINNDVQNYGYFVNSGNEILVNQALTEDYPVIIIGEQEPPIPE
ncbi:MAG: hypothetical protein K9G70_07755 [Prolixibacteraceae bacterium]|nr:hypothetical protein [Prolixibacteraceae bacterium]